MVRSNVDWRSRIGSRWSRANCAGFAWDGQGLKGEARKTGPPARFCAYADELPDDFRPSGLSGAYLALSDHPLVPVCRALDPVLRRVSFKREQTDDRIAAAAQAIDARVGREFHCLPDAEFVL
jgi:hypothetical protein